MAASMENKIPSLCADFMRFQVGSDDYDHEDQSYWDTL